MADICFTPLDILLFRGVDHISKAIEIAEHITRKSGDYSHVGIIVNKDILPNIYELEDGVWYVWESTVASGNETHDVESGKLRGGVQIRPLNDVLQVYEKVEGGQVFWAPLRNNPWLISSNRPDIIEAMYSLHETFGRRIYQYSIISLLAVIFPRLRKIRDAVETIAVDGYKVYRLLSHTQSDQPPIASWVFCSELVAIIYQKLGIISPSIDPRNIAPVDFEQMELLQQPILIQ